MPKQSWWKPFRKTLARLAPPLLTVVLRLLRLTVRVQMVGDAALTARWRNGEHAIIAFWHNRLLMLPLIAEGRPTCIMVSQHRDGEIATQLLDAWGIATVRGSATRGAVGGFLRLVDAYRGGANVAVVPDGPRGPKYVAKPGVVYLAKALQTPIYPVAYAASRVARLRSWDGLMIPLPFARVRIEFGEPLQVPADASPEQLEGCRVELEQRLNSVTQSVEALSPA